MQAISPHDKVLALGLMRTLNKDMFDFLRSAGKIEKPQIETGRQGRTESDLTEVLRKYDEALENAAKRDLEAKIASHRMDSAQATHEAS